MNKAIAAFGLELSFANANKRIVNLKGKAVPDITEDLSEDNDFMLVIVRKPGDAGSFTEPQNVPITKNVLKMQTVKVFCEEWLKEHSERKSVEYFNQPDSVFNLALVYPNPEFVEPKLEIKAGKGKKVTEKVKIDPAAPAKQLVAALTSGGQDPEIASASSEDDWDE